MRQIHTFGNALKYLVNYYCLYTTVPRVLFPPKIVY